MINLEDYLYNKVRPVIETWTEGGIYAISFFVYSNEAYEYKEYNNISEFAISYNTEEDCDGASEMSEERWNFVFWRQNMPHIIEPYDGDEATKILFQWYEENGIKNIGYENYDEDYDEQGNYISKGPVGYYELLTAVSNVARKLQTEGIIKKQFGKDIPIIVHDMEYTWYIEQATRNANPNGEADVFLKTYANDFTE